METIKKYRPLFKPKRILKSEQLEQLVDQSFSLPNCLYYKFSNGIVSGFEITADKDNLIVSHGVFRYNNEMFVVDKQFLIPYGHDDKLMYLKLCFVGRKSTGEEDENEFYITLEDVPPTKSDIELCRFRLQKDAKLRTIYDDFEDMNTEFDTINLIYSPFSCKEGPTINLLILKRFIRELKQAKTDNAIDTQFIIQVSCTSNLIEAEGILSYLELRNEIYIENPSNIKIYKELKNIIKKEKSKERTPEKKPFSKRKIIVN